MSNNKETPTQQKFPTNSSPTNPDPKPTTLPQDSPIPQEPLSTPLIFPIEHHTAQKRVPHTRKKYGLKSANKRIITTVILHHISSKRIIKDYSKALCKFASSKIAMPYIASHVAREGYRGFDARKFVRDMRSRKKSVDSMETLGELLVEEDEDFVEEKIEKRVFKHVSLIFMRYFAVNWIFGSRMRDKKAYLGFRFKMLRRVSNPECFVFRESDAKDR